MKMSEIRDLTEVELQNKARELREEEHRVVLRERHVARVGDRVEREQEDVPDRGSVQSKSNTRE